MQKTVAANMVATGLDASAKIAQSANADSWNYKQSVVTMFTRATGECTKVTITKNCLTDGECLRNTIQILVLWISGRNDRKRS